MGHGHTMVMSQPSGRGVFWPMLQRGWTLKTLSHEDTYSQEEIVHESTSSSVHGKKPERPVKTGEHVHPRETDAQQINNEIVSHTYQIAKTQVSQCLEMGREAAWDATCHSWCVKKQLPTDFFGGQFGSIWKMWRKTHLCVSIPFQGHTLETFSHLRVELCTKYFCTTAPIEENLKPF